MKVMVGLSGGVDSAAAAYLLKEQGYEVAGATFRLFDDWDEAKDAKAVADFLGIPHYIFDFREIFKKEVLDNFTEEYKKGRTPNPCVRCNKFIKFPAFFEEAQKLGYDLISTGHYARTDGNNIFRAKNLAKDQSYMMYNIDKELIPHLRFPLADLSKDEIRAIAEKAGIPVANKPDSQDICFIPDGDTQGYIEREKLAADKLRRLDNIRLPKDFDYNSVQSLSTEARQKLIRIQPNTIGEASRIPGVSPNDVSVLLVLIGR